MAKKKAKPTVDLSEEPVRRILQELLAEFRQRDLGTQELVAHYKGLPPKVLKEFCCADGAVPEVDFDLALKELIAAELVKTGPMEMYDNKPGSGVMILGFYSKNEYSYLTQDGYKAAVKLGTARPSRMPTPHVHISGGTFHQSPIGVGENVIQTLNASAGIDEVIAQLRTEIEKVVTAPAKQEQAFAQLDALQQAPDKPSKLNRYFQIMGVLSDHITVLSPVLQLLLHKLS